MGSRGSGFTGNYVTSGGGGSSDDYETITRPDGTQYRINKKTGEATLVEGPNERGYLNQPERPAEQKPSKSEYGTATDERGRPLITNPKTGETWVVSGHKSGEIIERPDGTLYYRTPDGQMMPLGNGGTGTGSPQSNTTNSKVRPERAEKANNSANKTVSDILSKYHLTGQNTPSDGEARRASKELREARLEIEQKNNGKKWKKWSKEDRETYKALQEAEKAMGSFMLYQ